MSLSVGIGSEQYAQEKWKHCSRKSSFSCKGIKARGLLYADCDEPE
jgi:hypothetical protein